MDERPDFLGDGAPVGGGGQLAEDGEQAEVDALEDHVGLRDGDVPATGLRRSKKRRTTEEA